MACMDFTETITTEVIINPSIIRLESAENIVYSQAIIEYQNSQGGYEYVTTLTGTNPEIEVRPGTYRITLKQSECETVAVAIVPADLGEYSGITEVPVYDVYPGKGADCESSVYAETFTPAQLVSYTKLTDSGNGDFTVTYEFADQIASDRFLAIMAAITGSQNRTEFSVVGPWIHPRQLDSYSQDGLFVTVQWDHTNIEEDTPDPLILPCVDPVSDNNYDTSNDALRAFYEAIPLSTPQTPAVDFTYTVTQYVATGLECMAIKQRTEIQADGTATVTFVTSDGTPYAVRGNISIDGCECCEGADPIEIPDGIILPPDAVQSLSALTGSIRSFAVKALAGGTYDISFDSGSTWLVGIDGADEYGQGNILELDVSNTVVRAPSGNSVYVHWEYVV